ncbi:FtsW/RodA/SpoVE family cell cycle protein [Actinocatenispora rupis]|uniref:Putative cell division protein RodA n=1 Tax=Actinocatenispora rupis TaxID=519421 RepID=A0A8J3J712_9ACTN|nr:putative cell division protein RodA [Actinocatenispora rupis]
MPTRRNTELALLLFGFVVTALLSAAAQAALINTVRVDCLVLPVLVLMLGLVAHVVIRIFAPYADPVLLPLATLINGVGVVFIHRVDVPTETDSDYHKFASIGATDGLGIQQVMWTGLAVIFCCALIIVIRDHRTLARYAYTFGLAGIVLVAIPAVLPGSMSEVNGAKVWIRLPFFAIQPGELAKLALFVFFAYYLVRKREVLSLASKRVLGIALPRPRDLGPVIVVWIMSVLILVFEKDLGSSLLFLGTFVVMLYIATERKSWLVIGFVLFAFGAFAAYSLGTWLGPFRNFHDRVDIWLNPMSDPLNTTYQLSRSLISLGVGGLFGAGPGAGDPTSVPLARSDFIIATIGEELGMFGLAAILLLYLLITLRGVKAGTVVRDPFGKLLAGGLAFSMSIQVFVIVGGVTDLIPLTGLTTPFLSYGGSSLVANWILIGLLIRISNDARRPSPAGTAGGPSGPPPQLQSAATEVIKL